MEPPQTILVTGGAGYVGAVLVPKLLSRGHRVRVLDLYLYGNHVFAPYGTNPNLTQIRGDIRDSSLLKSSLKEITSVIHLACISNDPSCDLDPRLTRSVNYDAFLTLLALAKQEGIVRFLFASSASVYGISQAERVTEDHPRIPITDYNRYKARCEDLLTETPVGQLGWTIVRPATVCGYSPRLRLDLTVNLLTHQAVHRGVITVWGGNQWRPNLHIEDMTDLYVQLIKLPIDRVAGKIYNVGHQNLTVTQIAERVQRTVESRYPAKRPIPLVRTESNDSRSYRITSDRIAQELGFIPQRTIEQAVDDLCKAFEAGKVPDPLISSRYVNVKRMKELKLT